MHKAVKESKKAKETRPVSLKGVPAAKQKGQPMTIRPSISNQVDSFEPNSGSDCAHCQVEGKIRRRDFSEQAWSVLVVWNEVQRSAVDQAICDDCYNELREVLIDRADEIEFSLRQPSSKPAASVAEKTGTKKHKKVGKMAS